MNVLYYTALVIAALLMGVAVALTTYNAKPKPVDTRKSSALQENFKLREELGLQRVLDL